jgi:hypothetical protein
MSISFMSVISVNNEPIQILTPIHYYITYGKSNSKVDIGDIVKIANSDVLGKVCAITKESVMVQWNGIKETSILPLFLAENVLELVEHKPRVFDIIIVDCNEADKEFWYHNVKGKIFKAVMDNTMFYVNNFDERGDYLETSGIFTIDARIIDASKGMSLNPARFFLEKEFSGQNKFAVSDKGALITRDINDVVYLCSHNGSLKEPLVLTKEIQESKWYMCKNIIE